MKQTAVEWLFEQFFKVKWDSMKGNIPTIFEKAKEMEKEQIIIAWEQGNLPTNLGRVLTFEEYYKETYGNK